MTTESLGAIAELVAALATIATLFYLALQIRGSTNVARAEAQREYQSGAMSAQLAIAQDPTLASLLSRGLGTYPNLEDDENTRFTMLLFSLLNGIMLITRDAELGLSNMDDLEVSRALIVRFLSPPGGKAWFEDNLSVLPQTFVRFVEKELG
jgi:hypothetical protein